MTLAVVVCMLLDQSFVTLCSRKVMGRNFIFWLYLSIEILFLYNETEVFVYECTKYLLLNTCSCIRVIVPQYTARSVEGFMTFMTLIDGHKLFKLYLFFVFPSVLEKSRRSLRTFYFKSCLLYTSPSPRDATLSRMPSSA